MSASSHPQSSLATATRAGSVASQGFATDMGTRTQPGDGSVAADAPAVEPGDQIGRYRVGQRLGAGGMGEVFAARDLELDRDVALKLIASRRLGSASAALRECERLRFEAQALARLSHPNVVAVHEVGRHGAQTFLAMELVDGPTLDRFEPRSLRDLVEVYVQAGCGLAAAHAAGLAHRDFKPGNVLIGRDGRVRVVDFGLAAPEPKADPRAKAQTVGDDSDSAPDQHEDRHDSASLGGPGTLPYMAPEQAFDGAGGALADQFSFCVALFEAVYGVRPFPASSVMELLYKLDTCRVELPGRPVTSRPWSRVPKWLVRVLRRGLAREPGDRFPSMDALLVELGRDRRRAPRIAGFALFVSTLTAAAVLALVPGALPGDGASDGSDTANDLAGVWDGPRRESLVEAFARVDASWASSSEAAVVAGFDGWSRRHLAVAREIHAVRDRGARAAMQLCLTSQREHANATLDLLIHGQPSLLEGAVAAVDALPESSACLRGDGPGVDTAGLLPQLQVLAEAAAQRGVGNPEQAQTWAEASLADARERGLVGLELAALRELGLARIDAGHRAEGLNDLEQARRLAMVRGDRTLEAELAVELAWASRKLAVPELRRERLELARAHVDGLLATPPGTATPSGTDRHAELLAARVGLAAALDALARGEHDEAEAELLAALARAERAEAGDTTLGIELLHGLAQVRGDAGMFAQAEHDYLRALARATRVRGSRHPLNARLWFDAGALAHERGELDLARERLELARDLRREALRVDHPELARAELGLAQLAFVEGDRAEARARASAAVATLEGSTGDRDPLAEAHRVLGQLDIAERRWPSAVVELELALAGTPEPGLQRALVELELGKALAETGEHRRGVELLDLALPVVAARLGEARCAQLIPSYERHAASAKLLGQTAAAHHSLDAALRCASSPKTRARLELALADDAIRTTTTTTEGP